MHRTGFPLFFMVLAFRLLGSSAQLTGPLNCSDTSRQCSAFLHYLRAANQQPKEVETMFNVWPTDITMEKNPMYTPTAANQESLFIKVRCSCSASASGGTPQYSYRVSSHGADYQGLEWRNATVDGSWLLCGCSDSVYPFLLSYVITGGDTISSLSSRFNTNSSDIAKVNNVRENGFLANGVVYYIPLSSVPGVSLGDDSAGQAPVAQGGRQEERGLSLAAIMGIVGGAAIFFFGILWCLLIKINAFARLRRISKMPYPVYSGRKAQIMRSSQMPSTISREMMAGVAGVKPIVFSYEEIVNATDNFKDSNMVGQGAFGSVYRGILREQEVAVKRMKATKTREFLAEIKILCNVHHSNLIEMIGYASSEDELFLVYEYAENKSLSDRLHAPLSKGYPPLTWMVRVQIALDAARGLEYIHDHTKAHYVHRDVKTSNILLDGDFRAKIADFGLAKLVEQVDEDNLPRTRVVGTFGYLAPEYLRDGQATSKADVYAFGVVLFELITGQEAISRGTVFVPSTPERRSLISIVLAALKGATPLNINKLRDIADPTLDGLYPADGFHRVASLGKQCVEENPALRPSMKQVVFALSQVLFNSVEWEATLAGNSQIFSSIMQGR